MDAEIHLWSDTTLIRYFMMLQIGKIILCMQVVSSDYYDYIKEIATWKVVEMRDIIGGKWGISLMELLTKLEITKAEVLWW